MFIYWYVANCARPLPISLSVPLPPLSLPVSLLYPNNTVTPLNLSQINDWPYSSQTLFVIEFLSFTYNDNALDNTKPNREHIVLVHTQPAQCHIRLSYAYVMLEHYMATVHIIHSTDYCFTHFRAANTQFIYPYI